MYSIVPQKVWVIVPSWMDSLQRPKSVNFTWPGKHFNIVIKNITFGWIRAVITYRYILQCALFALLSQKQSGAGSIRQFFVDTSLNWVGCKSVSQPAFYYVPCKNCLRNKHSCQKQQPCQKHHYFLIHYIIWKQTM